jgi:hypothetical protein
MNLSLSLLDAVVKDELVYLVRSSPLDAGR